MLFLYYVVDLPKVSAPDTADLLVSAQISERNIQNSLNMLETRDGVRGGVSGNDL